MLMSQVNAFHQICFSIISSGRNASPSKDVRLGAGRHGDVVASRLVRSAVYLYCTGLDVGKCFSFV